MSICNMRGAFVIAASKFLPLAYISRGGSEVFHGRKTSGTPWAYLLLVFGVSFPLSAEAFETFGPMHIPIATKGYENLFVALVKE